MPPIAHCVVTGSRFWVGRDVGIFHMGRQWARGVGGAETLQAWKAGASELVRGGPWGLSGGAREAAAQSGWAVGAGEAELGMGSDTLAWPQASLTP